MSDNGFYLRPSRTMLCRMSLLPVTNTATLLTLANRCTYITLCVLSSIVISKNDKARKGRESSFRENVDESWKWKWQIVTVSLLLLLKYRHSNIVDMSMMAYMSLHRKVLPQELYLDSHSMSHFPKCLHLSERFIFSLWRHKFFRGHSRWHIVQM